jgi:hypothetical protein
VIFTRAISIDLPPATMRSANAAAISAVQQLGRSGGRKPH